MLQQTPPSSLCQRYGHVVRLVLVAIGTVSILMMIGAQITSRGNHAVQKNVNVLAVKESIGCPNSGSKYSVSGGSCAANPFVATLKSKVSGATGCEFDGTTSQGAKFQINFDTKTARLIDASFSTSESGVLQFSDPVDNGCTWTPCKETPFSEPDSFQTDCQKICNKTGKVPVRAGTYGHGANDIYDVCFARGIYHQQYVVGFNIIYPNGVRSHYSRHCQAPTGVYFPIINGGVGQRGVHYQTYDPIYKCLCTDPGISVDWVPAVNQSCSAVCANHGGAVESPKTPYSTQKNYVCRAQALHGLKSGTNRQRVCAYSQPYGPGFKDTFECLCKGGC